MSATTNSSSLFASFRDRLAKSKMTGQYTDVLSELQKNRRDSGIELKYAESSRDRNRSASDARSAFASGVASRSKKLFRPKGPSAFSAIGKTDAATDKALVDRRKALADLDELDPDSEVNQAKLARAMSWKTGKGGKGSYSLGNSPITIYR